VITPSIDVTRVYLRALLWTMLGCLGVFAISDENPVVFLIGATGIVLGWARVRRGARRIPAPIFNTLILLVVLIAVFNTVRDSFTVESFAFFSVLLLILRLFDMRGPREHGQAIILSLGFLIAAALTSSSMFTGIGLFAMTLYLTRTVLLFRMYAAAKHGRRADPALGRRGVLDLRSMQLVVGFFCFVLAVVVFLIMPRNLGRSSFGDWNRANVNRQSGFSSEVELGQPGRITDSPTPVLRVRVRDRDDRMLGAPDTPAVYLRGSVLSVYASGNWRMRPKERSSSPFDAFHASRGESVRLVADARDGVWTREYEVDLEPGAVRTEGFLFAPWKPLEMRVLDRDARLSVDQNTRMIRAPERPVESYAVRVRPNRLGQPTYPQGAERRIPEAGEIPTRVEDLARQILADAGLEPDPASRPYEDDPRAMRALEAHFTEGFGYTLDAEPVPPGRDATEWFLFERREGHCEFYASALALMARAVGIPSRVVTGYVVAEYNEVSGVYVVRQSNAHAWVEALVAPRAWRTYDATPAADFQRIHEPAPTRLATVRKLYDALEHLWVSMVVSYDDESRDSVLGDFSPEIDADTLTERFSARFAAGRGRLIRAAFLWSIGVFVGTVVLGLAVVVLVRTGLISRLLARLASLSPGRRGASTHAATRLARAIDARLGALGAPRPASRPIVTHLGSIGSIHPVNGGPGSEPDSELDPLHDAVEVLYGYRFASDPPEQADEAWTARLRDAAERLEDAPRA